MPDIIQEDELLTLLRTEVKNVGSAQQWARQKIVSESLVSITLRGNRAIGHVIARALGYRKISVFERISK